MRTIFQSFIDDGGEKTFNLPPKLQIKSFGEFDHIIQILSPSLIMAEDPKKYQNWLQSFHKNG